MKPFVKTLLINCIAIIVYYALISWASANEYEGELLILVLGLTVTAAHMGLVLLLTIVHFIIGKRRKSKALLLSMVAVPIFSFLVFWVSVLVYPYL